MEFDDYENARTLFCFYKIVSFRLELFEEAMYAYESLGNVYKFLYQYNKAILCYKKLIELAWILGNREFELRAYDHIGLQYFYLCNKQKAKYYHDRFIYGLYEKDTKVKSPSLKNRPSSVKKDVAKTQKEKEKDTSAQRSETTSITKMI